MEPIQQRADLERTGCPLRRGRGGGEDAGSGRYPLVAPAPRRDRADHRGAYDGAIGEQSGSRRLGAQPGTDGPAEPGQRRPVAISVRLPRRGTAEAVRAYIRRPGPGPRAAKPRLNDSSWQEQQRVRRCLILCPLQGRTGVPEGIVTTCLPIVNHLLTTPCASLKQAMIPLPWNKFRGKIPIPGRKER